MKRPRLLCRINPYNGGVVFADPDRAVLVHRINKAMAKARTWKQFRAGMPRKAYSELMAWFDEAGDRRPRGSDPFEPDFLPGFSDGDYPPWLQQEMDAVVPISVLEKFGKCEGTAVNGPFWMIPAANLEAACAALRVLGYEIEMTEDLEFH